MPRNSFCAPEIILRNYFYAKDENRPHLLGNVFAPDATLHIVNNTETISFPAETNGLDAIADVLVRRFGQTYENVYSFYLSRPRKLSTAFSCDWLVGMSEKDTRQVRVGCGRYEWEFQQHAPNLARRLVIVINVMQILPSDRLQTIMNWFQRLDYPWTSPETVIVSAPDIGLLEPVLNFFSKNGG